MACGTPAASLLLRAALAASRHPACGDALLASRPAAGLQLLGRLSAPGIPTAGSLLHASLLSTPRGLSGDPRKGPSSSFLQQKRKALGDDALERRGQGITAPNASEPAPDAVVVQPNEHRASLEQVERVLRHPALVVSRPIEWGTVIFGYEQANRYTVYDQDGNVVAQLAEDYKGLGNELGRQLLRTRRSFTATVFSADGSQVIFRLRRPMYLISSTMFIEDGEGGQIGEIRQRWHPIRRNYDLYLGKQQFAAISGGFLAWEFELKDGEGRTLALVDRNFQGFGKELFTDAGKYVVHYGLAPEAAAEVANRTVTARAGTADHHPVTPLALARTDVAVIPSVTGNQLAVARPLQLEERMVVLAAAITIDYDFFSQHSNSGGWLRPPLIMPMPMPMPGASVPEAGGEGGAGPGSPAEGGAGLPASGGAAGAGVPPPGPSGPADAPQGDLNLGGDEFIPPGSEQGSQWSGGADSGDPGFKWDLPGQGGDGGDGGDGSGIGGIGGILAAIWAFLTGGD